MEYSKYLYIHVLRSCAIAVRGARRALALRCHRWASPAVSKAPLLTTEMGVDLAARCGLQTASPESVGPPVICFFTFSFIFVVDVFLGFAVIHFIF